MLRSLRSIEGMSINAIDGQIGEVTDTYFDDQEWTVRHLVVDAGTWLPAGQVLISPMAVREMDFGSRQVDVVHSRARVCIETGKPVSQQGEPHFSAYNDAERRNPHLRSVRAVAGYHIEALDGSIGHVEDFLYHELEWALHFLIVDTRNRLPGHHLILPLDWVTGVSWEDRIVQMGITRDEVHDSPEWQPQRMLTWDYQRFLHERDPRRM